MITMALLLAAMIDVESSGDNHAVGDQGRAIGCLQIHKAVLTDVNHAFKTDYILRDCYDRYLSCEIARRYLSLWGRKYQAETGNKPSAEVLARIWNGGPRGWQEDATGPYWDKVKQTLRRDTL